MDNQREQNGDDHDLLIELRTEMKGIRSDLKEMKDGIKATIDDHERRLRVLEDGKSENTGASKTWLFISGFAGSAITFITQWVLQHK